ncbi:unnamed protein product [Owenia fusiformis]|uniref:Uncharacterized protein n=1 Tax=Owenia fusiformis TaxID=6347 RepID=A0A8J1XRK2_OWEFU|nr:unnamed protein product [Owenia fusiformis]
MNQEKQPKPSEGRRASKPMMEKRRRARINQSLIELKTLVPEAVKKDTSPHSKLEKADILEMTVRHLRQLQARPYPDVDAGDISAARYRAGYNQCANEVARFITTENVDATLRMRIMNHLANTLHVPKDAGYIRNDLTIKNNIECSMSEMDCSVPCSAVRLDQAQSRHLSNIAPSRDVAVVAPSIQVRSDKPFSNDIGNPTTVNIPQHNMNSINVSNTRVVNGGQLALIVQPAGQSVNLPIPVIPVYATNITNNTTPTTSTFANTQVLVPTIVYAANNQVQQQNASSIAIPLATPLSEQTRLLQQGTHIKQSSPLGHTHALLDRREKDNIVTNEPIRTSPQSQNETLDNLSRFNANINQQNNVWRPFDV